MTTKCWLALAAITTSSYAFAASDEPQSIDPTRPDAPVSTLQYQSAFEGYRPMAESEETPEQVWRAANAEMGVVGGHAGHIKGDAAMPAASALPKQPIQTETPIPKPPAASEGAHEGMKH